MKIIAALILLASTPAFAFSCHDLQPIIQKPIVFNEQRMMLTREYQSHHYGISSETIERRMIVLHWTSTATFDEAFRIFDSPTLFESPSKRDDLPGSLNVSSHFLVDRDGRIYQLMPETRMGRHVIGLNHYAIGIENVGGVDGKEDLTEEQAKANAFLVCYLMRKYPDIHHVIGHMEYLKYKGTSFWLEKDPDYYTVKMDPGQAFLDKVMCLINNSC